MRKFNQTDAFQLHLYPVDLAVKVSIESYYAGYYFYLRYGDEV